MPRPALRQLGAAVPQTLGWLSRPIGTLALRLRGWRVEGEIPDIPKFVIIVAPHTSNWDFPVGLAAKWSLRLKVTFLAKDSLFRPPLGWFMRAVGGMPVDRSAANAMVDRTTHAFRTRRQMVLVVAPEGTRKKVDRWRSGFWHIAKNADVPIVCAAIDWGRKVVRFGPTLTVNPDVSVDADIARMRREYSDVRGYDPTQQ
jgi:1-acyl-sn-glycerol-3-phosphate acyltransferase